jgi:hypothetical protein
MNIAIFGTTMFGAGGHKIFIKAAVQQLMAQVREFVS